MGLIPHMLQMCYNQYTVSSSSDDRYAGCDDINTVCVNVTAWCDILESVRDVICIHMMSCIFYLRYHTYNEGYMIGIWV